MRRLALSLALLFFIVSSILGSETPWRDCSLSTLGSKITFTDFALFPNPVQIHQTVHVRAIVNLGIVVSSGTFVLAVRYKNDTVLYVPGLNLCTLSPSIACPLRAGENVISFDWLVPAIAPGNYSVHINVAAQSEDAGCVEFSLNIEDKSDPWFKSWYEAILAAPTHYQNENMNGRNLGDVIQVGPHGYLDKTISRGFEPGTVSAVSGSEDLIPEYLDTTGYRWGMWGNMTEIGFTKVGIVAHQYQGIFYLGYEGELGTYDYPDNPLFTGTFNLTWTWNATTGQPNLNGFLYVLPETGGIPAWWPQPLTFGRLNPHTVYTDDNGILRIAGAEYYCVSDPCPELGAPLPPPEQGYVFSDQDLGLTIGLILGFAFLVVLLIGILLWLRHKRRHEEEDGVFSVSRKPEYGSALVVDDIVQESKGHSGPLLPRLDRRRGLQDLDLSDFSDISAEESPRRGRHGRGGRRRRDPSRSRSDPSLRLRDSSRSRSRSPTVSRSPTFSRSRSRSISPAGSDNSISRSRSRRRSVSLSSDSEAPYSAASDSSRSRSLASSRSVSRSVSPSGSRSATPSRSESASPSRSRSASPSPSRSDSPPRRSRSLSGSERGSPE